MSKLTTIEMAEKVGLSYVRINQMIQAGEVEAEKIGRDYVIDSKYIQIIINRPEKRGRKPKDKTGRLIK